MKRLVILGGGESGVGTAILGKKNGYEVFVSDQGRIKDKYREVLKLQGVAWEDEKHSEEEILNATVVMKSPGIPDTAPLIQKLRERNIPVISEIEFASGFSNTPVIGITGSNGKTTVTNLVQHLLKAGSVNSGMGGNIGNSYAKLVAEENHDWYVLELSSFQLDGIENFRPHIAILTNITPDHLDRYDYKFENYIESKFKITKNQTAEDYFIYDADDPVITEWLEKNPVNANKLPFSLDKRFENGAYLDDNHIVVSINNNKFTMPTSDIALEGKHNTKNAMAAATVSQLLRIRKQTIRESMANFQGVEHRLEKVLKINNVMYINDSKATNVNATYFALDSMEAETIWIVGGVDKGNVYDDLLPFVNEKVKAIICLGVDNMKIKNAFGNIVENFMETNSMEEAVQMAYNLADKGDNVLLSPACASFDLFENYEDRGRQFKNAVRNL